MFSFECYNADGDLLFDYIPTVMDRDNYIKYKKSKNVEFFKILKTYDVNNIKFLHLNELIELNPNGYCIFRDGDMILTKVSNNSFENISYLLNPIFNREEFYGENIFNLALDDEKEDEF